ncbi:MAG: hypothetical protein M1515_03590 [Candidatus Thermoplasmatota archaeon]|nr:hypothetical protein [Candidatus Thermoplasmatota archaeon]
MSDDTLGEIKSLLEDIKTILMAVNLEKTEEAKKKLLKAGSIEAQVYDLCDGINTNQDIANNINKSVDNVNAVLSSLRRKGLIRQLEGSTRKIHVKVY